MQITGIKILNFLGIDTFVISDLGKYNKIIGGNSVGKSAVLKAIMEAFKSSGVDPQLIKLGEDESEIAIEIDDRILVERKIREGSNKVKVTDGDMLVKKPQTFLDNLIGPFIFNPIDFFKSKGRERRELLLSAIPHQITIDQFGALLGSSYADMFMSTVTEEINFDRHSLEVLEDIKRIVYDARAEKNRDVTRLEKSIEQDKAEIPDTFDGSKFEDFNLEGKVDEMNIAIQKLEKIDSRKAEIYQCGSAINIAERGLDNLKKQIEAKEIEIQSYKDRKLKLTEEIEPFDCDSLSEIPAMIKAEIAEYESCREVTHRLDDINRRSGEANKEKEAAQVIDGLYKYLNNEVSKKILETMDLPIEGLELADGEILVNGVALDKLATSEQMRLSIKIARALAGELKIICIDRCESLDLEVRRALEDEAKDDGFEYFITIVTGGDLNFHSEN